jgi:hypothetical protein
MVDAELEDWEKELENDTPTLNTSEVKKIVVESEEIIKPKFEPKPIQEPKINPDDYEIKWQEKNKELIERRRKEEEATAGMSEKDKQKKLIDMRIISDATDFLEVEKKSMNKETTQEILSLVTEKDFVDLSISNVSRIKSANKPSQFTLKYLKNSIELLGPTLDADKLDVLIKDLTVIFNKKLKEKTIVTKQNVNKAKPTQSTGKGLDRAEKMGALDDFGGRDDLDDEDYEEDDFI